MNTFPLPRRRTADSLGRVCVAALLLTATLGFQLFRPMLESLLETDGKFEETYKRHLEMALESFRRPRPRGRER